MDYLPRFGIKKIHGISCTATIPVQSSILEMDSKVNLCSLVEKYLEPQTTIFHIKIWNHPIVTTIYKWFFGVPGTATIPIPGDTPEL